MSTPESSTADREGTVDCGSEGGPKSAGDSADKDEVTEKESVTDDDFDTDFYHIGMEPIGIKGLPCFRCAGRYHSWHALGAHLRTTHKFKQKQFANPSYI